jgi:hypothetical protein
MIITTDYLQNALGSVQILKSLGPVPALMVVETQVRVAVGELRVVVSQNLFLNNNTLRLKFDGLQEVAHLVLDVGHLRDARGNLRVHGAGHLKQEIYDLVVQIESFLVLSFIASSDGLLHHLACVLVLVMEVLRDWEEVSDDAALEWHVRIFEQLFVSCHHQLLGLVLLLLLLLLLLSLHVLLVLQFG